MIKFRNIDQIKFIVKDATGLDIMYAYDDLIFPEHGAFLMQFSDDDPNVVFCHFHKKCPEKEQQRIISSLKRSGTMNSINIQKGNCYHLSAKNETEIEIKFLTI
ncbi:hypothetical protein [Marinilabilia sp.]|uniref:hypothetical protein n=1 Tax=Marinilabilia sp. TaxID=2021252 RepID=UPI0025C0AD7C|nr:hypothetical protein [Marinilabilia sp.]